MNRYVGRTPGTMDMILHGPAGNFVNRTPIPEEAETPPARRRRFNQGSMVGYGVCQMRKFAFQDSSLPSERGEVTLTNGEKEGAETCSLLSYYRHLPQHGRG